MKKMLPLLVVIILVMSGIGVLAFPIDKQIEKKPQSMQDWELEIKTKAKLSGYKLTLSSQGTENVKGNLTVTVATHGKTLMGKEFIWPPDEPYDINMAPGESEIVQFGPLLGIGSIKVVVDAIILTDEGEYLKSVEAEGFLFLIFAFFSMDPLILPYIFKKTSFFLSKILNPIIMEENSSNKWII